MTRGPIVVLTADPDVLCHSWFEEYLPEMLRAEAARYPTMTALRDILGDDTTVANVPIPLDCTDGFAEAYYGRPESLLDPAVRRAQSAWTKIDAVTAARSVERLRIAVVSGKWDARHGALRTRPFFDGALRLVVAPR